MQRKDINDRAGKTVKQWFLQAKQEGYQWADAAIQNSQNFRPSEVYRGTLSHALHTGFAWDESPEGHRFWRDIYEALKEQDQ